MSGSLAKVGIVVGPKGRGSNMAALIEACRERRVPAETVVVISPRAEAPALETARGLNVHVAVVEYGDEYPERLLQALGDAEWICLAGYLRVLPSEVLDRFPGRILNIHPSLLPKFGGVGMYGRHVHEAVLAAGETVSGCTVHYVTPNYDEGPPLLQRSCPVLPDDTPDTLAARVLVLEHEIYPEALALAIRDAEK